MAYLSRYSNNKMKHTISLFSALCLLIVSCDDGHVDDPAYDLRKDGFNVQITGTFDGLDSWQDGYSVVAAAFDGESEYSLIQKTLPSSAEEASVKLSGIPAEAHTVEIAVVNTLRKRIATLRSYALSDYDESDTIRIAAGALDVSMFSAISQCVLDGSWANCSMCHQGASAAARLDLSAGKAYASLVNVPAEKNAEMMRVLPYDASKSFFYKVIAEGDENVGYSHTGLFSEDRYRVWLDVIRLWIEGGAR